MEHPKAAVGPDLGDVMFPAGSRYSKSEDGP
jgi:hypothetical protein